MIVGEICYEIVVVCNIASKKLDENVLEWIANYVKIYSRFLVLLVQVFFIVSKDCVHQVLMSSKVYVAVVVVVVVVEVVWIEFAMNAKIKPGLTYSLFFSLFLLYYYYYYSLHFVILTLFKNSLVKIEMKWNGKTRE
jgi:hypothetical protein